MTLHCQIDSEIFSSYVNEISPSNEILTKIQEYNDTHPNGKMMVDPIQMRMMVWLANLIGTQHYLEIGVFTGYSSTAMGLGLPVNARLYVCDINTTYTNIAKTFWDLAGINNKIKLYLQPALITLEDLLKDQKQGFFDFVLIDADKACLANYVEKSYPLLRSGGIIAIDNTYQRGKVVKTNQSGDSLSWQRVKQFNQNIMCDNRFSPIMLPLGDGLTLLVKK